MEKRKALHLGVVCPFLSLYVKQNDFKCDTAPWNASL